MNKSPNAVKTWKLFGTGGGSPAAVYKRPMAAKRVFVVDDTNSIRQFLSKMIELEDSLELAGMAESGHEAIPKIQAEQPDVVIVDAMMADMDGMALTQELKKVCPDVTVVGFTSSQPLAQQMRDAGANVAVVKTEVGQLIDILTSL